MAADDTKAMASAGGKKTAEGETGLEAPSQATVEEAVVAGDAPVPEQKANAASITANAVARAGVAALPGQVQAAPGADGGDPAAKTAAIADAAQNGATTGTSRTDTSRQGTAKPVSGLAGTGTPLADADFASELAAGPATAAKVAMASEEKLEAKPVHDHAAQTSGTASEAAKEVAMPAALKELAAAIDQQPGAATSSAALQATIPETSALASADKAEANAARLRDQELRPTPLSAVPIEIGMKALAGVKRFDIRLDPPELGRVDVRIEFGRDGDVTASLVVDRTETMHLLQRDSRHLERALEQAGLKTGEAGVQISLSDRNGEGRNAQGGSGQPEGGNRGRTRPESITPEISRALDAAQSIRITRLGGVDVSV